MKKIKKNVILLNYKSSPIHKKGKMSTTFQGIRKPHRISRMNLYFSQSLSWICINKRNHEQSRIIYCKIK